MAEFKEVENEAETGIGFNEDGVQQQGIASTVDCWELVGSSPGSPSPESSGDVIALEQAIASACNSGILLQDNYFGYAHGLANEGVLPVSTAVADKAKEDEEYSPEKSDSLVSLASDTDAIQNSPICDDSTVYGNKAEVVDRDDVLQHDDHMHDNDPYHDDLPSCSSLMYHDDHGQHAAGYLHHHKMHDEFMMYSNEFMEHADKWHAAEDAHFEGSAHTGNDNARCIIESGISCGDVGSMAVAEAHHDVCALGLSSGLESFSHSPMSRRWIAGDSHTSMVSAHAEGRNSAVVLDETGREATSQVVETQESENVQPGTIASFDKRQHKSFAYVSWIWTHLVRWQTQLGHANTIWSVALAAAVMGILVLGRGWRRLQAQNQSLRSQLWAKEKRITQLMFQLMQTKDALVRVRRVPVICVKPSLQIPQDNF